MVTLVPTAQQHNLPPIPPFLTKPRFEEPDNDLLPMRREIDRLKSYKNWPCKFMEPSSLAKAGFFYVNKEDIVRCAFCSIEIGQWERGDNAMLDHQKWSDNCPFVHGRSCGNVPIEIDAVPISSGQDTCGRYGMEIRPNSYPERENGNTSTNGLLSKLGVPPNTGPAYPLYVTLEQRLNSYKEWPRSMKQKPDELSAAGFFYNGKGDQTVCFHCGGGLKDWEEDDNPWEQHAKWFSKCNYVLLQKGPEYISEVCSKQPAVLTSDEAANLQVPSTSSEEEEKTPVSSEANSTNSSAALSPSIIETKPKETKAKELVASEDKPLNIKNPCKICFAKEVGVFFVPCGHIVACTDCASALTNCAICRKPLEATVRAFLS